MKDKAITEIQTKMAHVLNNEQLDMLQKVMVGVLQSVELIQSSCENTQEISNNGLLKAFYQQSVSRGVPRSPSSIMKLR
ncbi:hypothetical protein LMT8_04620 [Leuconostoc mesenteroides subsp. cremoris TIFN8]|nr:hypothetical protein LMT8_04620 [Leuconostoc mesenteroides subsp. cremoris TIFN8]